LHPSWRGRPTGRILDHLGASAKPPLLRPVPAREYLLLESTYCTGCRYVGAPFFILRALSAPMGCACPGLQPRGGAFFAADEARCGAIRHRSCHSYDRRDGWCHCAGLRVHLWLCPASRSARPIGCDQDAMYAHSHRTSSARRTSDARVDGQHGFTTGLNQATSHARRARRPDAAERRGLSSSHGRGVLLRIGLEEGSGCATHVSAAQSQERHVLQNFFWPSRWLPRWSNTAPRVRCRRICHVCSRGTPPTRAAMRGPMRRTLSSAADEFSDDLEMQT